MDDSELSPLLAVAADRLAEANASIAKLQADLPGLLVERQTWERSQKRILVAFGVLGVILLAVLVYLVPTAARTAASSAANAESLAILRDATSDATKQAQQDQTVAAVCMLIADAHALHGAPPPTCPTTTTTVP